MRNLKTVITCAGALFMSTAAYWRDQPSFLIKHGYGESAMLILLSISCSHPVLLSIPSSLSLSSTPIASSSRSFPWRHAPPCISVATENCTNASPARLSAHNLRAIHQDSSRKIHGNICTICDKIWNRIHWADPLDLNDIIAILLRNKVYYGIISDYGNA